MSSATDRFAGRIENGQRLFDSAFDQPRDDMLPATVTVLHARAARADLVLAEFRSLIQGNLAHRCPSR